MPTSQTVVALLPALQRAAARAAARFPGQVNLVAAEGEQMLSVRADAEQLESALGSLAIMACQSLGGQPGRVAVSAVEILFDDVVLDSDASKLLGGLPPRSHVRIHIGHSGEVSELKAPAQVGDELANAQRLGLAAVRDIVSAHHGALTASFGTGAGACFDVFLPTVPAPAVASENAAPPPPIRHVLYVDDYEAMCELAWESLTDRGYRVTCYMDPVEALAAVKAHPQAFDIVVVDFNMPRRSGIDMARALGGINAHLPVVIISGYVDSALELRAHEAGARALVDKSHNLDQLGDTVGRLLAA